MLISAGEASGEMYGAELIEALQQAVAARPEFERLECFGVGGERMRAAGCETVVDAAQVAVVGLAEVVKHLPGIYREFHKLLREVDRRKPDVAVLIDFPDFNFRLAKQLHARGIPVVYYVSPQLWAWRQGRIELVKKYIRKMLVIFPFESEFYAGHGVDAEFVGHPLAGMARPEPPRAFLRAVGAPEPERTIALLPGSRRREVEMNLPTMLQAAALIPGRNEFLIPVASTLNHQWVSELVQRYWFPLTRKRAELGQETPLLGLTNDARTTLASARAAIVASGTATVEAALIGTPFVIVYKLSPLTYFFGKRLVNLPHYGMPNLIAGREVVPELVQEKFTAHNVAAQLCELLDDGPRRDKMLSGLAEVRAKLQAEGARPADRAAKAVLGVLSH